jgi:hypothetical protein
LKLKTRSKPFFFVTSVFALLFVFGVITPSGAGESQAAAASGATQELFPSGHGLGSPEFFCSYY